MLKAFLAAAGILILLLATIFPFDFNIESPRLGQPHIVEAAGGQIEIHLSTSVPFIQPQWQVSLESADMAVPLSIVSSRGWLKQRQLTAAIPASDLKDLNQQRFMLTISAMGVSKQRPSAVFVVRQLTEDIDILHLADLIKLNRPDYPDANERMDLLVEEINLIRPDLVIFSGDLAKGGRWDQYEAFVNWIEQIEVPVVLGPGNHAYDGWGGFLESIGNPNHKVEWGEWCIITANSGHGRNQWTLSQFDWINEQASNCIDGKIIVHTHHPVFYTKNIRVRTREFVDLMTEKQVPLVLSGHWHQDAVYNQLGVKQVNDVLFPGTRYITTTAAGDTARNWFDKPDEKIYHGYRMIRIRDGEVTNYSFDFDKDGNDDPEASAPWRSAVASFENNQIKLSNAHNVDLVFNPLVKSSSDSVCLEDGTKPATSRQVDDGWEHRFRIQMSAQSSRSVNLLQGTGCR